MRFWGTLFSSRVQHQRDENTMVPMWRNSRPTTWLFAAGAMGQYNKSWILFPSSCSASFSSIWLSSIFFSCFFYPYQDFHVPGDSFHQKWDEWDDHPTWIILFHLGRVLRSEVWLRQRTRQRWQAECGFEWRDWHFEWGPNSNFTGNWEHDD